MQIQVQHVKAHIARTDNSHERIHVRAIIVQQTATLVNKSSNLLDILLKQSQCVRICHHDTGNSVIEKRFQVLYVDKSVCLRFHLNYLQTADSGRSWICAVGAIWNDDACTLDIATRHMILADDHQTCKLAMRTGKRIESELCHSCYRRKRIGKFLIYSQDALHCV